MLRHNYENIFILYLIFFYPALVETGKKMVYCSAYFVQFEFMKINPTNVSPKWIYLPALDISNSNNIFFQKVHRHYYNVYLQKH